jgi:M6 family metalloprotease-like protein
MVSKEGLSPFPSRKYTETRRSYRAEQSVLLVAVSFEDVRVQTPEEELAKRLLEVSAAWHELSGGQHRLVPARENYGRSNDGVVSIQLDRTHGGGGEGKDFMEEILVPLAKEWDADAYDLNGDGILDPDELHVILLVAGRESESPVEEPSVLSHRIRLSSDRTRLTPWVDLPGYMVIGEIWEDGNLTPTGVFLHELGHSFDLPDLYGPPSPRGIGEESLMARGYRTEAGGVAPLDPFSRIQLGLIEAVESSPPLHLRPGEGSVLKVPSEGARYVLVEILERGVRFWVVDEGKINGRYEENRLNADPMDPALRLFRGHKGATFDLKAPFLVGFEGMRFRSSGDGKLQILK